MPVLSESKYPVQYDDLFIYAPSFALYEEVAENGGLHLWEGKYVGTARTSDLSLTNADQSSHILRPEEFAKERQKGATVGKRQFKKVKKRTFEELLSHVRAHDAGKTWDTDFREEATKIMKRAWRDVFLAGLRASGVAGRGKGNQGVDLAPGDERWLRSAMQHEMRFLNKFMAAVTAQDYSMPLARRTKMYADALESFYDSARVIGMPDTTVARWTGKKDKKVCKSCAYLKKHNPYHKSRLPTTPRSGLTICLTNCRDRLLLRVVDLETSLREQARKPTRETMIRHLRKLKQQRK